MKKNKNPTTMLFSINDGRKQTYPNIPTLLKSGLFKATCSHVNKKTASNRFNEMVNGKRDSYEGWSYLGDVTNKQAACRLPLRMSQKQLLSQVAIGHNTIAKLVKLGFGGTSSNKTQQGAVAYAKVQNLLMRGCLEQTIVFYGKQKCVIYRINSKEVAKQS